MPTRERTRRCWGRRRVPGSRLTGGALAVASATLLALPAWADPPLCPEGQEPLVCARALSADGKRAEALALLEAKLRESPANSDWHNLHASILSWEGRFAESREEFSAVLRRSPGNYDAVRGLIRVELWDDHPSEALALADDALRREPESADLPVLRARALRALGRRFEAREQLDEQLRKHPNDQEASDLLHAIEVEDRKWGVGASYVYDHFNDGRADWHEVTVQGSRVQDWGRLILRYNHAKRFSSQDDQGELEAFPSLWSGAYADISLAVAPREQLYPIVRVAADVYQSLGWGFEASLGYRYLAFSEGVNIIVASLGKYWGDWYFVGRTFLTPDAATGLSQSYHLSARRYFLAGDLYAGLRYGHGWSREEVRSSSDVQVLDSNTGAGELGWLFGERFEMVLRGSYSHANQPDGTGLSQISTSIFLGASF